MEPLQLLSLRVCLFLALSSACFAAVTPRKGLPLATSKSLSKYDWYLSQSISHVRKASTTPRNFAFKARLEITSPRRDNLSIERKAPTNRFGMTVNAISARTTPLNVISRQSGLNFDTCTNTADCVGSRVCVGAQGDELVVCSAGMDCFCGPINPEEALCSGEGDCDNGESCLPGSGGNLFCVSNTSGSASGSAPSGGGGLTLDPCSGDTDCTSTRRCALLSSDGPVLCNSAEDCVCFPASQDDLFCSSDSDCDNGESCGGVRINSESICASNEAIESLGEASGSTPPNGGDGLNLDPCSDNSDCATPRLCAELSGDSLTACGSSTGCFCIQESPEDRSCTSNSNCDAGESCATLNAGMICVSDEVLKANPTGVGSTPPENPPPENPPPENPPPENPPPENPPSENPPPENPPPENPPPENPPPENSPPENPPPENPPPDDGNDPSLPGPSSPSGTGLSFDPCSDNAGCAEPRECRELSEDITSTIGSPCTPGAECRCFPAEINCNSDSDCDDGETCTEVDGITVCASENGASFLSEAAVCIGSDSLTHFAREDLTFEQDALAHVLCDMNESCATPGHMVVYRGEALMMKNYCKIVGCARRVKRVNSPKYVRKLVVPSKTQDLVFTAFAARFETLAEEGVLSAAVRFGL